MKPKIRNTYWHIWSFPHSSVGKESAYNAQDLGSIPGSGRSPGEGSSYPFQYTCLENPMDRGVWQATILGVSKVGRVLVTKPLTLAYIKILHQNTQQKDCSVQKTINNVQKDYYCNTILITKPWK